MSKQLIIYGVPKKIDERLEFLSQSKGQSVNSTVLQILEAAVGVEEKRKRLERYATWTPEEFEEFERNLSAQRTIDKDLWR